MASVICGDFTKGLCFAYPVSKGVSNRLERRVGTASPFVLLLPVAGPTFLGAGDVVNEFDEALNFFGEIVNPVEGI